MLLSEKQLLEQADELIDESFLNESDAYSKLLDLADEIKTITSRLTRMTDSNGNPYLRHSSAEYITDEIYDAKKKYERTKNLEDLKYGVLASANRLERAMREMRGISTGRVEDIINSLGELSTRQQIAKREEDDRKEVERNQHNYAMRELEDRSREEYDRQHAGNARREEQNSAVDNGRRDGESGRRNFLSWLHR